MNDLQALLKEYEELGSPVGGQLRNKKYKDFKQRLKDSILLSPRKRTWNEMDMSECSTQAP